MRPKILLVDDREDNLLSMEAILADDRYELFKALSGREALKILLHETDFAIILMDVKMPVLNGFETANLIHEREKLRNIPIIFITANSYGDENVFKGYQSGGIDYILKPINPEILRAKVSVFAHLYEKNQLLMEQEKKLRTINQLLGTELTSWKASEEKAKKNNSELMDKLARLESLHRDARLCTLVHSHSLLNPLMEITALSEELAARQKEAPPEAGRLKQAAGRAQQAFLDMLALSKIPVGHTAFVDTDLNELLKETLAELDETIKETNAALVIEPLPALPVIPELARALFENLIRHALTSRQKDADPVIRIRSEIDTLVEGDNTRAGVGPYCHVFLDDNGPGFGQRQSEDIFDIFKKYPDTGSPTDPGIGLALCKKIMTLHNGFITARSHAHGGAVVTVSWPLHNQPLPVNVSRENNFF